MAKKIREPKSAPKKNKYVNQEARMARRLEEVLKEANYTCQVCGTPTRALSLKKKIGMASSWHVLRLQEKRYQKTKKYLIVCCTSCAYDKRSVKKDNHSYRRYRMGCRCMECRLSYRIYTSANRLQERLNKVEKEVNQVNSLLLLPE